MRRRKLIAVLAGLVVLFVGLLIGVAILLAPPRTPQTLTPVRFKQIRAGMTRAEVEAILGPPGDYSTGAREQAPLVYGPGEDLWHVFGSGEVMVTGTNWESDAAMINVSYDSSGKAVCGGYFPRRLISDNPIANALWRAKRLWRRWFPE
jgi:hypothetical protein